MLANGQLLKDGFFTFDKPGKCVAIADGVGGNAGGQEASEFVLNMCKDGIAEDTKKAMLLINDELLKYAKTVPGKEQMATTLSLILFAEAIPFRIVHVGNTRISAIQGEYLKQLTKDHTTVEILKARGESDLADGVPQNEITACLGSGSSVRISQLQIVDLDKEYAGYIITSDGLHDYLDEEIIEDFAAHSDYSEEAFHSLINQAKERGSIDDKSIIVLRVWE